MANGIVRGRVIRFSAVDDRILAQIAADFGTPTYVYDLAAIRGKAAALRSALPQAGFRYAVKANPSRAVLQTLGGQGFGAEVITVGELERANRAGIPAERIVLGGPGHDVEAMERALELGVGVVSIDNAAQWRVWQEMLSFFEASRKDASPTSAAEPPRFLVRVNPALDPRTHPHLATGSADSKFGMTAGEALTVAAELVDDDLLAGFHFHIGSQIASVDAYRPLAELARVLFDARPEGRWLDLGGGFAVPDFPLAAFAEFATELAGELGVGLLLEPGRFLVAEAGVLLTRVRYVKEGPTGHVIADAGMAELLRPALYGAQHPVRRLGGPTGVEERMSDLDGPLCENADRLGQRVLLPGDLARGDLLVVEQAGAYGMAMSSNYASSVRPAEVVIDGDDVRLVRARETVDDLMRAELA